MTSIGGPRRTSSFPAIQTPRLRRGVIAGVRSKGTDGLAQLMARFPTRPAPRPGSTAIDAGRLRFPYPRPRRPSIGPSRLVSRMPVLQKRFAGLESMQETVRNKRQMASTAFQNFDQKANQLYNLLSSVMKAMNEMRMGTVRNML